MIYNKDVTYFKTVLALAIGAFSIFANLYSVQPLLPLLSVEYDKSLLETTAVLTMGTLGLAVSLIFYGVLSDAIGRYRIMVLSLACSMAVSIAILYSSSFEELLWLRLIHGFVLGALPAVAIAYIGDEFSPHLIPGVVGVYIATNTLGGIGGRLIGGIIADYTYWKNIYWVLILLSGISLVSIYFWLSKPKNFIPQPLKGGVVVKDVVRHLTQIDLLIIYIVIGISFGIFINLYSYLAFILVESPYNLGTGFVGALFITYLSGTFSASVSGRVSNRIGALPTILVGIAILSLGIICLFSKMLIVIIIGLLINSFGLFLAHSVASGWVNKHAKKAKATASSLYLVFYYLGATLAPALLYPFWVYGGWNAVLVGAEVYILFALFLAFGLYIYQRKQIKNINIE